MTEFPAAPLDRTTRLRVTAGDPTPEEIAAVVVALAGGDAASPAPAQETAVPAWTHAARREALGSPPVASPGDLRLPW